MFTRQLNNYSPLALVNRTMIDHCITAAQQHHDSSTTVRLGVSSWQHPHAAVLVISRRLSTIFVISCCIINHEASQHSSRILLLSYSDSDWHYRIVSGCPRYFQISPPYLWTLITTWVECSRVFLPIMRSSRIMIMRSRRTRRRRVTCCRSLRRTRRWGRSSSSFPS